MLQGLKGCHCKILSYAKEPAYQGIRPRIRLAQLRVLHFINSKKMISRYFSCCKTQNPFGWRSVTSRFDCFGPRASCRLDRSPTIASKSNLTGLCLSKLKPLYSIDLKSIFLPVLHAMFFRSRRIMTSRAYQGKELLDQCTISGCCIEHNRGQVGHMDFQWDTNRLFLLQSYSVHYVLIQSKTHNGINVNGQSHEDANSKHTSNFNNVIITNNQKNN